MSRIKRVLNAPVIVLAGLVLVFFFPIFFLGQVFYVGDIYTIYLPMKAFLIRNLQQGIFPLWNPEIFSGYPVFADLSLDTYYLPALFLFINSTLQGISFLIVAHFFLAGYFMFKLGNQLGLSNKASFLASIIFSFSGIAVNYIADPKRLFTIALYPLFYYLLVIAFKKNRFFWTILCAMTLSLQIAAGHIQYVLIGLMVLPIVFLLTVKVNSLLSRIRILIQVVIIGILFSSVIIFPAIEFFPFTTRIDTSKFISIYDNYSLKPQSLVRFVFANFWGIKNEGSAWGTMDTTNIGYVGVLPLLLILRNIRAIIKKRERFILVGIVIFSLAVSFGTNLPIFGLFINTIPVFSFFRNPMVFMAIYTFGVALLAAYAFDSVGKNFSLRFLVMMVIFLVLSLTAYLLTQLMPNTPFNAVTFLARVMHKSLSQFHTFQTDYLIANFILLNFLFTGAVVVTYLVLKNKNVLLVLVFLDLLVMNRGIIDTQKYAADLNPIAKFIENNIGHYRYLSISEQIPYSGVSQYFGSLSLQPPFSKEGSKKTYEELYANFLHEAKLLPPNFATYYGLKTINGYNSFVLRKYYNFFQKSTEPNLIYKNAARYNPNVVNIGPDIQLSLIDLSRIDFNDPLYDQLAVKFIVTDKDLGLQHHKEVYGVDGISVFENKNVIPRAVLIDPNGLIVELPRIIYEDANSILLKTEKSGKLVLRDTYYPGWKAKINGQSTPLDLYDGLFRVVSVDNPGIVSIIFEPLSFKFGLLVTVISLVTGLFYMLHTLFRRGKTS